MISRRFGVPKVQAKEAGKRSRTTNTGFGFGSQPLFVFQELYIYIYGFEVMCFCLFKGLDPLSLSFPFSPIGPISIGFQTVYIHLD